MEVEQAYHLEQDEEEADNNYTFNIRYGVILLLKQNQTIPPINKRLKLGVDLCAEGAVELWYLLFRSRPRVLP
jgi:hypothetical protein